MITLALHSETHIALRNSYQHKDAIKSLASYPDVQWGAEAKAWLLDVGLLEQALRDAGRLHCAGKPFLLDAMPAAHAHCGAQGTAHDTPDHG
jgi:hypothetical protein